MSKKGGAAEQRRVWCFTINNPKRQIKPSKWADCRICVWQLEEGAEGTRHYQGYVEFTKPHRLGAVKKLKGMRRAHLEPRAGTKEQAVAYCTKQDATFREGPWFFPSKEACVSAKSGGQGARVELEAAVNAVKEGASNEKLVEDHGVVAVKYYRGLEWVRLNMPVPAEPVPQKDCVCYWGPTRTGKSWRVRQECPEGPEWFYCSPGKWMDGYQGQPGLVFDEMRDSWLPWEDLLRLLDVYPKRRETKGGTMVVRATKFRITTNVHPKYWYQGAKGKPNKDWENSPLRARFSKIILMDQRVDIPGVMEVEDRDEPPDLVDDAEFGEQGQYAEPAAKRPRPTVLVSSPASRNFVAALAASGNRWIPSESAYRPFE